MVKRFVKTCFLFIQALISLYYKRKTVKSIHRLKHLCFIWGFKGDSTSKRTWNQGYLYILSDYDLDSIESHLKKAILSIFRKNKMVRYYFIPYLRFHLKSLVQSQENEQHSSLLWVRVIPWSIIKTHVQYRIQIVGVHR